MNPREIIPLAALLLFLMLLAGSVLYAGPRIERELSASVRNQIEKLHYDEVSVSLSGQDALLSGTVETVDRKSELRDAVEILYGIRVVDLAGVSVIATEGSDGRSAPLTATNRYDGLIYLAVQVLGFLAIAVLLGLLLGWSLFSAKPGKVAPAKEEAPDPADEPSPRVRELETELAEVRSENERLRASLAEADALASRLAGAAEQACEERDAAQTANANMAEASPPDDLTQLKGVGGVLAKKLNDHGVIEIRQIAEWSPAEIEYFTAELNGLKLTLSRYDLVAQAQALLDQS